jgi:signal transduction histidine kinase
LGNPKYVDYAESIQNSGQHLLGIINDVLDLSKHQAGKLELAVQNLDLTDVAKNCAAMMRDQCSRAGLALRMQLPRAQKMRGDAGKLQQMLLNLLSNAVKFTERGGTVTIVVEPASDERIMLQVIDTGIGMSPEQIPIAMAPFGQVDGRLARRYDGTGLGLPLVKSIAELHGGEMIIDSASGQGTTVTVLLPREPGPAALADASVPLERVA